MTTISPYRGVEVPTVSSDSGTWGTLLNDTIEFFDSILGKTTVLPSTTYGTDITLSSSQARCVRIDVTSASTSQFTLRLMSSCYAMGLYVVKNGTGGALTCQTGSTAVAVSIGSGLTGMITSDGTDVKPAYANVAVAIAAAAQVWALSSGYTINTESVSSACYPVDGGNVSGGFTPDFTTFINWKVTLTGNATMNFPGVDVTPLIGSWRSIQVVQDGAGSHSLGFGGGYKFDLATAPSIDTNANHASRLTAFVRSSNAIEIYLAGRNNQ